LELEEETLAEHWDEVAALGADMDALLD